MHRTLCTEYVKSKNRYCSTCNTNLLQSPECRSAYSQCTWCRVYHRKLGNGLRSKVWLIKKHLQESRKVKKKNAEHLREPHRSNLQHLSSLARSCFSRYQHRQPQRDQKPTGTAGAVRSGQKTWRTIKQRKTHEYMNDDLLFPWVRTKKRGKEDVLHPMQSTQKLTREY